MAIPEEMVREWAWAGWRGCMGSPEPCLCHGLGSRTCFWASQWNQNLQHAQCPQRATIPKGSQNLMAVLPTCSLDPGGTHTASNPCSPADMNPHHIHPPLTATEAQAVLPSLTKGCFTNYNLKMLNKIAANSKIHYKKRKGEREGWVCSVWGGINDWKQTPDPWKLRENRKKKWNKTT